MSKNKNIEVYVNKYTGSDSSGDGSLQHPYQSVEFALDSIKDNSANKKYTIHDISEEATEFYLKPNAAFSKSLIEIETELKKLQEEKNIMINNESARKDITQEEL